MPRHTLDANAIVFCSGTLLGRPLQDKIDAAVAGHFDGITLFPQDVHDAHASGWSDAEIRTRIQDAGLQVEGLDPFLAWLPGDVPDAMVGVRNGDSYVASEAEFFAIAEGVGGASLNIAQGFSPTIDRDRAAEAIAGLCDRAAEVGLAITLEFLPWSGVPDVDTALDIVERSGRASARIMLDTWHWFRGSGDLEALARVPADRIGGVQLNDARKRPAADLVQEGTEARLVPGAGAIPLTDVIARLDAAGAAVPMGVEVFCREFRDRSAVEVGRQCGDAVRATLAAARSGGGV